MDATIRNETAYPNNCPAAVVTGATLYQAQITPSSRKVRMFLTEKNVSVRMIDVTEGFGLSKDYFARYRHGTVPMLELQDGTQLGESMAICRYIDELYPDCAGLFGVEARDRAIVDMWERRSYLEGMGAIDEIFRNSHPLMIDRGLPGIAEPIPQIPALVRRGQRRLYLWLEKLEERLVASKFIAGERFSVADITMVCAFDFAKAVAIDIPPGYKSVLRWHSEISSRPSASA